MDSLLDSKLEIFKLKLEEFDLSWQEQLDAIELSYLEVLSSYKTERVKLIRDLTIELDISKIFPKG